MRALKTIIEDLLELYQKILLMRFLEKGFKGHDIIG